MTDNPAICAAVRTRLETHGMPPAGTTFAALAVIAGIDPDHVADAVEQGLDVEIEEASGLVLAPPLSVDEPLDRLSKAQIVAVCDVVVAAQDDFDEDGQIRDSFAGALEDIVARMDAAA